MGVHFVEQPARVAALQVELAERAHVDDSDPLADGAALLRGVAVGPRAAPRAGVHPDSARPHVPLVHRRALHRLEPASGEHAERDRLHRRPGGGGPGGGEGAAGDGGAELAGDPAAHLALTGPHRDGEVALDQLGVVEAFVDCVGHVVRGDVLAGAEDRLAPSERAGDRPDGAVAVPSVPGAGLGRPAMGCR